MPRTLCFFTFYWGARHILRLETSALGGHTYGHTESALDILTFFRLGRAVSLPGQARSGIAVLHRGS